MAWVVQCGSENSWLLHPASQATALFAGEYAFAAGHALVADDQGVAAIPRLPWTVVVAARQGALFGWAEFWSWQPGPARLRLGVGQEVEIQVVDANGLPQASIPVVLLAAESGEAVWQGLTQGPEGKALARFEPDRLGSSALKAGFQLPIGGGQLVAVDPERPVRLVLPPSGRIVARLIDGRSVLGDVALGAVALGAYETDEQGGGKGCGRDRVPRVEGADC